MKKVKALLSKHKVITFLILFITLIVAGLLVPIDSYVRAGSEPCSFNRHELIFGGSLEDVRQPIRPYIDSSGRKFVLGHPACAKDFLYLL